jgi:predicted deacylase
MPEPVAFQIGQHTIAPGTRQTVELPVSVLSDHTPVMLSAHVIHGRRPGPTLFVSAAVHGDEIIGVEVVRRLLRIADLDDITGTLLAIPIVNTFGFMNRSRYLPDRRDLNRSFPGSTTGSLAARLAHLFFTEIVCRSDYGIDLHSAAIHRENLPQIRVSSGNRKALELAIAFGAPFVLTAPLRPGSLRDAAEEKSIDVLLYEAGEGLRFDESAVRTGVSGILRVMQSIGMIESGDVVEPATTPVRSQSSSWIRAPIGGLLRAFKSTGSEIAAGDVLGMISDPFGDNETEVIAKFPGLIIGRTNLPSINEGDGLFHVARVSKTSAPEATIESLAEQLESDPLFDEDEII